MKTKYIIRAIIMLTIVVACEPSHLEDNLFDSVVYFSRSGDATVTFYDAEGTYDYSFYAVNAGYFRGETTISIASDASALEVYNQKNSTSLLELPSDCYTFLAPTGAITNDKNTSKFSIQFKCNALKALSQTDDYSDLQNYVVPIALTTDGGIAASDELNTLFVHPEMQKVSVLALTTGELTVPQSDIAGTLTFDFSVSTSIENKWETTFNVLTGDAATKRINSMLLQRGSLEAYSALVSTPANAYTINFESTINSGTSISDMTVTVDASKVPLGYSSIVLFLDGATISGEESPVDGTPYMIIHFANVTPVSTTGIISVTDRSEDASYLGKYLDNIGYSVIARDGWQFSPDSYHNNSQPKAIDGNTNSIWENRYNDASTSAGPKKSLPFNAILDLGQNQTFSALELWRRPSSNYVSDLRGFEIYISDDGSNWKYVTTVDYGTKKDTRVNYSFFEEVNARYINLYMTKSNRSNVVSIDEIFVWKTE